MMVTKIKHKVIILSILWILCITGTVISYGNNPGFFIIIIITILFSFLMYNAYIKILNHLNEKKGYYLTLFEKAPLSYHVLDENGNLKNVNQEWLNTLGYLPEDVIGKNFGDFLHLNYRDCFKNNFPKFKSIDEILGIEFELIKKDGSYILVSYYGQICNDIHGNFKQMHCILHDITMYNKWENLFQESEEKFRLLFSEMKEGLYLHELVYDNNNNVIDYRIIEANNSSEIILNICSNDAIGKLSTDLFKTESPPFLDIYLNVVKTGESVEFEEYFPPLDKYFYISAYRIDEDQFATIFYDITERKLTEKDKLDVQQKVANHEKLALVGQVAGKMAHDFNNILSIIMGNAEVAFMNCQDDKLKNVFKLILDQSMQGKNLTKNLVAFSKDQEPEQRFFQLGDKIKLVLELMKTNLTGIETHLNVKPVLPDMFADPGMIEHAFINLLQNAIHAVSMTEFPKININVYSFNHNIYFEIEDNGCGIPSDKIDRIYDPSFTLKGSYDKTKSYKSDIKGTGYGMSNIYKYIDQHNGSISVESELNVGTKFTIMLPVIGRELTSDEKIKLKEVPYYTGKRILLVEDEQSLSDVQYKILTQYPCNHIVHRAENALTAINLFHQNEYDCVSLDHVLPGELSGMDIYYHIRQTNQTIPILFISGNMEFLESIKEAQLNDNLIKNLSKPCLNINYINTINSLFELSKTINKE